MATGMRSLKLTLAYDGTRFAGWQYQPGRVTVQGTLEEAIQQVTGERTRIRASSRTDAGVHALGQVAGWQTSSALEEASLQRALNARLPDDVVVLDVAAAPEGFHPTRDAIRKRYRYVIDDGRLRNPFERAYSWHYRTRLDVEAMDRAGRALVGRHDFRSFESNGSPRPDSVRTMEEVSVRREPAGSATRIVVETQADGFLYNMVRAIVGTLVEVGRGVRQPDWVASVLAARSRSSAGPTAPPQGLFLVRVDYSF